MCFQKLNALIQQFLANFLQTLDSRALSVISGGQNFGNDGVYEDGNINMKKMISCVT